MALALDRSMPPLQSILVPVDGSPPSLAALEHAVTLVEDGAARVVVLHVDAPEEFSVGSATPMAPAPRKELDQALELAIRRARTRLGGRITRVTVAGEPLRAIIEAAREGHHDLVVIGTHGRTGRLHALLGSVAEGVVRNAPCPVLTVREPGGGYQSFAERRHGRPTLAEQPTRPSR